jgi:uncharacterized OB-fold protein
MSSGTSQERIPIHPGLFSMEGEGGGRLLGGVCASCQRVHFPRLATCPYCTAEGCSERPLSPTGTLYLYTTVLNRPPGYKGEVPFGFGVVELPEGLRVITRITETELDKLRPGMPMRLVLVPLHSDDQGREVVSYAFAPVAG